MASTIETAFDAAPFALFWVGVEAPPSIAFPELASEPVLVAEAPEADPGEPEADPDADAEAEAEADPDADAEADPETDPEADPVIEAQKSSARLLAGKLASDLTQGNP